MKRPGIKFYRRSCQILTALAFILIPYLNHLQISLLYGNFLAFKCGPLPLADPLAVLQIILKNNYWATDLLIGAAIALIIAATLGTVFCSWICPFGLLSELTHRRQTQTQSRRKGFPLKFTIFALGIVGFLIFSTTPILNQLSLPAWYSRIFQVWFEQKHISLALAVLIALPILESLMGRRIWCRYICPQAVLLTLTKQLNPRRLKVTFTPGSCTCKGHSPCADTCHLDLNPRRFKTFPETECTNCGDCITTCKNYGKALGFGFGPAKRPSAKASKTPKPPRTH